MELIKKNITIGLALGIGLVITIGKFTAYFITNSAAILTDALESIINIAAGAFAFYSIYLSARPKDKNHPYGHGKVEFFAVGFEGALIIIAGLSIMYKAILSFIHPQPIRMIFTGIIITGFAGVANYFLGNYLIRKGKSLNSVTLEADGKHLLSDSYTSIGLIVGLMVIKYTGIYALDSIFSIVLGGIILYNGYHLIRKSISGLMDEVDTILIKQIVQIFQENRVAAWIDIHNLRVQKYGADIHIDCHVTMPYYFDLNQVHDEITKIELLIAEKSKTKVELFIHVDPCVKECCFYCEMSNCSVRKESQREHIFWTLENVMNNGKHYKN